MARICLKKSDAEIYAILHTGPAWCCAIAARIVYWDALDSRHFPAVETLINRRDDIRCKDRQVLYECLLMCGYTPRQLKIRLAVWNENGEYNIEGRWKRKYHLTRLRKQRMEVAV